MPTHRWMTLVEAVDYVAVRTGSRDKAEAQIKDKLKLGKIRAIAAHYADTRSQAEWRRDVKLPPSRYQFFWNAATIDWATSKVIMDGEYRDLTGRLLEDREFSPIAEGVQVSEQDVLAEWESAARPVQPDGSTRKRGPEPKTFLRVVAAMAKLDTAVLAGMQEKSMEAEFGASRDTCRKARAEVLSTNVGVSNSDK